MRRIQSASINPFGEERGSRRRQGLLLNSPIRSRRIRLRTLLQPSVGVAIVAYAAVFREDVHNCGIRSKVSFMRSEIVFELLRTTNRFALCHLAFKAIHKLHNPSNRIQDTANDALRRLAGAERQASIGPENASDAAELELKGEPGAIAS